MLYPQPKGPHCLNCVQCKRIIRPPEGTPIGAIRLHEDSPRERYQATLRCALEYWGNLPDGTEKRYASPWVAVKSDKLRVVASRCPDYETDD